MIKYVFLSLVSLCISLNGMQGAACMQEQVRMLIAKKNRLEQDIRMAESIGDDCSTLINTLLMVSKILESKPISIVHAESKKWKNPVKKMGNSDSKVRRKLFE